MSDQNQKDSFPISRETIQKVLDDRISLLSKVEKNVIGLKRELDHQSEQAIGLNHRINELKDFLK